MKTPTFVFICEQMNAILHNKSTFAVNIILLTSVLLVFAFQLKAQSEFENDQRFKSTSEQLAKLYCDSIVRISQTDKGFEALFLWHGHHILRFSSEAILDCTPLPGEAVTDEVAGFQANYLHTNRLDYFSVLHPPGGYCYTFVSDYPTSQHDFKQLVINAEILKTEFKEFTWPDYIAADFRLQGTLLQFYSKPSEIEGFTEEVHLTMLNDSIVYNSLKHLADKFDNKDDFIQNEKMMLLSKGTTITKLLANKQNDSPIRFIYYLSK